jgi:hypothetical protein
LGGERVSEFLSSGIRETGGICEFTLDIYVEAEFVVLVEKNKSRDLKGLKSAKMKGKT